MLDIEKLRVERELSFDRWFDEWWFEDNIEKQIVDENKKGYSWMILEPGEDDEFEKMNFKKDEFIEKLKEKLPGFKVKRKYIKSLFVDTFAGVEISWE